MKKGFIRERGGIFFSIDALIAVVILFFVVVAIVVVKDNVRYNTEVHQDILYSLSVLKIGEVDSPYVQRLFDDGLIYDENSSLLFQIGEFYANVDTEDEARKLADDVLKDLDLGANFGLWYGDKLVYSINTSAMEDATDVDSTRQLLSGVKAGQNVRGFSVRAFLSSALRNNYYYFGGFVGQGSVLLNFTYFGNITNASLKIATNKGYKLYINGSYIGDFGPSPDVFTPEFFYLPIDDFQSGANIMEIKGEGDDFYIAGGYLKVVYDPEVNFDYDTVYRFPGIHGLINLYDGFYVPGTLTEMEIFLHLNSSGSNVFLNIGNKTVFNETTNDEEVFVVSNAEILSVLNDYDEYSGKTIPLRLGLGNISLATAQSVDVFSVTDVSGSMRWCHGITWSCCNSLPSGYPTLGSCAGIRVEDFDACENVCGGVVEDRLTPAQDANKELIELVLDFSGNRVGLVGYNTGTPVPYFHTLSDKDVSLKNTVDNWEAYYGTCICCGINRAVNDFVANSDSDRKKSMIVMSDGQANSECGAQGSTPDLNGNGIVDDAGDDAIQAACDAYDDEEIVVWAIGFGDDVDAATMQAIADCGRGEYREASIDDISEVYEQILEDILTANYAEQTLIVEGDFETTLYPDSFIKFTYAKPEIPSGLVLSLESDFDDATTGHFLKPADAELLTLEVVSYSGSRWTSKVEVGGNTVFDLGFYGDDLLFLGDPHNVNLPIEYAVDGDNIVILTTRNETNEGFEGSVSNKILYKIAKDVSVFSGIKETADGCKWHIEFESGEQMEADIPEGHSAGRQCWYTNAHPGEVPPGEDAYIEAVLGLLEDLDLDGDYRVDVNFKEQALEISLDEVVGIPYAWTTEVQARIWY